MQQTVSSIKTAGEIVTVMKAIGPVPLREDLKPDSVAKKRLQALMRTAFFAHEDMLNTQFLDDMKIFFKGHPDLRGSDVYYFLANR